MEAKPIIVVGAGPAGMMAAIRAGQLGKPAILIEKNPAAGRKLLFSGKGRCNLTNDCDIDSFLKRFSRNGPFLRDAFQKFFTQELIAFFEIRGLKLQVERQQRVFPASGRSESVLEVLMKELRTQKVEVRCRTALKDITVKEGRVKAAAFSDGTQIDTERLVLATGGVSYAFTGSTGEGLEVARKLGHRIVPLKPGLVALVVKERQVKALEGLTLKNIRLTFKSGKKEAVSEIGELLFTSSGISGPLVLSLSGQVIDLLEQHPVRVEIDLKPALSEPQLDNRLLREFSMHPAKSIRIVLKSLLPQRLIDVFLSMSGIDFAKKANQITLLERKKLLVLLKELPMEIKGSLPIEEAMVTRGGVSLKDIDPRTMESRLVKGLYFAGEMIDVDADTGGFNLQAAFSTGYLAGESAALT